MTEGVCGGLTSYGWEVWLAAAGMWAAILTAVAAVMLYLKYRRRKKR